MKDSSSILIVDDSRSVRSALASLLSVTHQINEAADGTEALQAYTQSRPDIILLDLNMPGMNGLEVLRVIREDHNDDETYILILTADDSTETKTRGLSLGANDFLSKPFDIAELKARVGVAERQRKLTKQLVDYARRIQNEIDLVASLQSKLLPTATPYMQGIHIESLYQPSGEASGDYFDFFPIHDGTSIRTVVADVSGHGARAAFIMSIVRTLFRVTQSKFMSLTETIELLDKHLMDAIGSEEDFVTVFAADIDFKKSSMQYVNAGHCPGILMSEDGTFSNLSSTMPLLGFFNPPIRYGTCSFTVGSGLLLFTDGFFDWKDKYGSLFSLEDFIAVATKCMTKGQTVLESITDQLAEVGGGMPAYRDDLTALWIYYDTQAG
ncbi:PP2C family protein-serine/threonine phosphatase [Oleidesulfovibrio sp.]|uniref:PP2C family protein-serine/threonine phosphatase n=1 Tax=Oleidesulfovibrio sp. TaxID=2909707 RepID=UPI003A85784A